MAIMARKNVKSMAVQAGGGPGVWMESCVDCKAPITVVAVARPTEPRCTPCAQAHADGQAHADAPADGSDH
jgi:hypothetical protein